jgi:glutamate N-acetyltransferase/amino-acid N-acetyltransferase
MTTDLKKKELAVEFTVGGKTARIGGIAKGSGMIHPNMGTMLAFLTTDCSISSEMIQTALINATNISFNRVSVDGDTSTNDMLCLLSNGMAGNKQIVAPCSDYDAFAKALNSICTQLAIMIADDGEGATHLIACRVHGARTVEEAEILSKAVISSSLTKTAIFGSDANWGRILCALGYSGIDFSPDNVDISFESDKGRILVCEYGSGVLFDEALAKHILSERNITIDINMNLGSEECICWGCDLTYDYVKINGDYRS